MQANPYPLRIDPSLMKKLRFMADDNGRSINKEIEVLVKRAVKDYETQNGEITVSPSDHE
ncbi:MAG: Arc family DNA-binding protein [Puniceicoccales bacterium]|jgi:hypothetical protein|nr:Arc family DNA-binding protein [Puniceicoccales bacterium]